MPVESKYSNGTRRQRIFERDQKLGRREAVTRKGRYICYINLNRARFGIWTIRPIRLKVGERIILFSGAAISLLAKSNLGPSPPRKGQQNQIPDVADRLNNVPLPLFRKLEDLLLIVRRRHCATG